MPDCYHHDDPQQTFQGRHSNASVLPKRNHGERRPVKQHGEMVSERLVIAESTGPVHRRWTS